MDEKKQAAVRRVLQNENVQFRFLDQELSHASFGVAFSEDSDAEVIETSRLADSAQLH